jgi:hypothetical protein
MAMATSIQSVMFARPDVIPADLAREISERHENGIVRRARVQPVHVPFDEPSSVRCSMSDGFLVGIT